MNTQYNIGFLVFPDITPLDALGPAQFLARMPNARIHTIAKNLSTITTDAGFNIVPTVSIEECPKLDILCIPGGFGVDALMEDEEVLAFIRNQASHVDYLTSVCTGSLVLGAAGLLKGKKATTHWAWHDRLLEFDAIPVKERVVVDGNLITGGGVTAGIDFALKLIAKHLGDEVAKRIQLGMEYDPMPPFDCGSPEKVSDCIKTSILKQLTERNSLHK